MIDASNQFSNISQMQPMAKRRNKKYKTSMSKLNKNGKTTLIKPNNILKINNDENSYENILDRIMDYNKENSNSKRKRFVNQNNYNSETTNEPNKNINFKININVKLKKKNNK